MPPVWLSGLITGGLMLNAIHPIYGPVDLEQIQKKKVHTPGQHLATRSDQKYSRARDRTGNLLGPYCERDAMTIRPRDLINNLF